MTLFASTAPTYRTSTGARLLAAFLLSLYLILTAASAWAAGPDAPSSQQLSAVPASVISQLKMKVQEDFSFAGMAAYYNSLSVYHVTNDALARLEPGEQQILKDQEWLAIAGRLDVMLIKGSDVSVTVGENTGAEDVLSTLEGPFETTVVRKSALAEVAPELNQLRYAHLFSWLAALSRLIEDAIVGLHSLGIASWGLALVVFTVLLKIILVPLTLFGMRTQRRANDIQSRLEPVLKEIKAKFDGEEAHNRIMAAHRDLNVTPFFALKPLLTMFIQIPILIAIFNALGEMPQFDGAALFWIGNLAYPDSVATLPVHIPGFGNLVSLMPVIMTVVTVLSTLLYSQPGLSDELLAKQRRNLYLMAAVFLTLFYPFPAVMVLFWTINSLLQIVERKILGG